MYKVSKNKAKKIKYMNLEVKVKAVLQVGVLGEALVLLHIVGQGKVPEKISWKN